MFTLIAAVIQKTGLLGVGLLMLLENLVPIIPSELIMPMAGFEAARGAFSPVLVVVAGTAGSVVGSLPWYWVGRVVGLDRLARWADHGGRWLPLTVQDVRRGQTWFQHWGRAAVCVGRCLPGVRGVICLPAGVARMPFASFLLWSSLGALCWATLLTLVGYELQARFTQLERWLNPVTDMLLGLVVLTYLVRVARYGRGRKHPYDRRGD